VKLSRVAEKIFLGILKLYYLYSTIVTQQSNSTGNTPVKIDSSSGTPVYLQIIEQIKSAALHGRYRHGDRVPPVRELAVTLRINPNTVAKAYKILQEEGWMESRPGGGNFIVFKSADDAEKRRAETLRRRLAAVVAEAGNMGASKGELTKIFNDILNGENQQ
jgi:GntR family transcriptional regulator